MIWRLFTGPVDWLIGLALRARVASHRDRQANIFATDLLTDLLTEEEKKEEVEVVARAFDPDIWRGFDAYVQKLKLNADERAAARGHPHSWTISSLRRAHRAIVALDRFRRKQPRRD